MFLEVGIHKFDSLTVKYMPLSQFYKQGTEPLLEYINLLRLTNLVKNLSCMCLNLEKTLTENVF